MQWEEIYARLLEDREDPRAWTALAVRLRRRVRRDLRHLGQAVAEDVVADTCVAVALGFGQAHGARTFGGFVLGHYLNARRRALRTSAQPTVSLDGLDIPVDDGDAGPNPDESEHLRNAVAELPSRERAALLLRYAEELSAAAIAAQLGTSEGNARQLVHRALEHLRRRLGQARHAARPSMAAVGTLGGR